LIEQYLGSQGCCGGACGTSADKAHNGASSMNRLAVVEAPTSFCSNGRMSGPGIASFPAALATNMESVAQEFLSRALTEDLSPADVFRITITSFLDAYNFDVRRLMKCCIHHLLPSGHIIPFCAYNVLYRDGHVPLPEIRRAVEKVLAAQRTAELVEQP
jgi:hypothetical protein